jgi:hypothetical protein
MVKGVCLGLIIGGFLVMMGAVGSDCDGACPENALTIQEIFGFCIAGLILVGVGFLGLNKQ